MVLYNMVLHHMVFHGITDEDIEVTSKFRGITTLTNLLYTHRDNNNFRDKWINLVHNSTYTPYLYTLLTHPTCTPYLYTLLIHPTYTPYL